MAGSQGEATALAQPVAEAGSQSSCSSQVSGPKGQGFPLSSAVLISPRSSTHVLCGPFAESRPEPEPFALQLISEHFGSDWAGGPRTSNGFHAYDYFKGF